MLMAMPFYMNQTLVPDSRHNTVTICAIKSVRTEGTERTEGTKRKERTDITEKSERAETGRKDLIGLINLNRFHSLMSVSLRYQKW